MESDLAELESHKGRYSPRYNQIFGGTSNLKQFVNTRIKRLVKLSEITAATRAVHTGWSSASERMEKNRAKGVIGAANLGTQYWLQGLIDGNQVDVHLKSGEVIPVRSPRVGLIIAGPGYKKQLTGRSGQAFQLPLAFRQAMLIHEARHSDCAGGIRRRDLSKARESKNYEQFIERFESKSCGFLHSVCAKGELEGVAACEEQPWGPYAVEALFIDSALGQFERDSEEWQQLNALAISTKSRLTFDYSDLLDGKLGEPNLESSDQVRD